MTPTISFMLANYAARPLGYRMDRWEQAEQATSAYFKPVKSFAERFERYLADVRDLGFEAVDLWQPMLDQRWLKDDQLDTAIDLLDEYDLRVVSFAGWLGATDDDFERNCEIAAELDAPLLVGNTRAVRSMVVETLQKYGLKWAYETEVERTPERILAKIGRRGDGAVGVCADTGWFGTHGIDAAEALRTLAPHLLHVHLKDVRAVGSHETCRFGEGIVPVEGCVRVLQALGYAGAISIEHEMGKSDPSEDCRASLELLMEWIKQD